MKRILITGASRGIGRAIAQRLSARDCTLFLHGRDETALADVKRSLDALNAGVVVLRQDLRDPDALDELAKAPGDHPLDVLVNNAGIAVVKPFTEISRAEWDDVFAVNVRAPFLLAQRFAPHMRPGAVIVNILSVAAKTAFPNWSAYCMSKFALEGFSQALREELRPRGVRVVNIYPAATDTDIWNSVSGDWPRAKMMTPDDVADAVAFAVNRPAAVAVDEVVIGGTAGTL